MASYDWIGISSVITAIGVIIIAIIVPIVNSKRKLKEKEFEYKLDSQAKDIERRFKLNEMEATAREKMQYLQLQNIYSHLYGYIWNLLYKIDADRISIIQPHPEHDMQYISVSFEALHYSRDVSAQKFNFQMRKIKEWKDVIQVWMNNDFLQYRDIEEMRNPTLYAEAHRRGIKSTCFCKLSKINDAWIGTLIADYSHAAPENFSFVRDEMKKIAPLIADILPEYHPELEEKLRK